MKVTIFLLKEISCPGFKKPMIPPQVSNGLLLKIFRKKFFFDTLTEITCNVSTRVFHCPHDRAVSHRDEGRPRRDRGEMGAVLHNHNSFVYTILDIVIAPAIHSLPVFILQCHDGGSTWCCCLYAECTVARTPLLAGRDWTVVEQGYVVDESPWDGTLYICNEVLVA